MSVTAIRVGDTRRLTATFTDISDAVIDPTTITFLMHEPDGTETSYVYGTDGENVKSSTGVYYVDWAITQAGWHRYRWTGTGTAATMNEGKFQVVTQNF